MTNDIKFRLDEEKKVYLLDDSQRISILQPSSDVNAKRFTLVKKIDIGIHKLSKAFKTLSG